MTRFRRLRHPCRRRAAGIVAAPAAAFAILAAAALAGCANPCAGLAGCTEEAPYGNTGPIIFRGADGRVIDRWGALPGPHG